jgi:hypothetical protein
MYTGGGKVHPEESLMKSNITSTFDDRGWGEASVMMMKKSPLTPEAPGSVIDIQRSRQSII